MKKLNINKFVFVVAMLVGSSGSVQADPMPYAYLQWLDKVTARISDVKIGVDQMKQIGPLRITLRSCDRSPPQDVPESKAFLEIVELRNQQETLSLFTGWMFASSPAVNSLEHSVYDIWLVECRS